MTTETKTCTKCNQTKPLTEFHLRSKKKPEGPRRSHCKTCQWAGFKERYQRGLSVENQIARQAVDPNFKLSPEAEAAQSQPVNIDPKMAELCRKRVKAQQAAERRRQREARRERDLRPMRFAGQETFQ